MLTKMYNDSTHQQQQQQQQQPSGYYHYHHHHHGHHPHHRLKHSLTDLTIDENSDPYSYQNGYYQMPSTTPVSTLSPIQCSAYFIHRLDLDNYSVFTLRQTVDRVVTGPKAKGLKVKLSLPDEGLIIENIPDPNQSWMYKTSELLYFWRDPYYSSVVVVVTINRSYYHSSGPYSASIFRLRGNESVQSFIQRAQQLFAQLSASPTSTAQPRGLIEQPSNAEHTNGDSDRKTHRKKPKQRSESRKKLNNESSQSLQPSPSRSRATSRTEFEPPKSIEKNSSFNHYARRTYSETTVLSDAHTDNSVKHDNHSNGGHKRSKTVKIKTKLSEDVVAKLMRELKEIRSEIAELKLEARQTPLHAASTSPFATFPDDFARSIVLSSPSTPKLRSQPDTDAGTQTDLSLTLSRSQDVSEKAKKLNGGSNGHSTKSETKYEQSSKRSSSSKTNNNECDREETVLIKFYPINGSSNETQSPSVQEAYIRKPTAIKPRPILKVAENGLLDSQDSMSYASLNKNQSNSNSLEEDTSLKKTPIVIEKEIPKVLSTTVSSSKDDNLSSSSLTNGNVVSFRSSLEDTINIPEHFYENFPILIRMDPSQHSFHNGPTANHNDSKDKQHPIYVTIADDRNSQLQKQYLSQLFGSQNGIALLLPQQPVTNNSSSSSSMSSRDNNSSTAEETLTNNYQYVQPVLFANHLTNPLFNTDKQLLANTIANQFGVDKNSPYLQQLIANQHLFVTEKRTFANMVWQMSPEEINALCSSPITATNDTEKITVDSNGSISKSILKSNKLVRSMSKKQRITWDRALE